MRKIFLILLAAAASTWCQAAEVSKEQAMEQAKAFMCQHSGGRRAAATIQLYDAPVGVKHLHAFNVEGGGFIIMSASDQTAAVLGYAESGSVEGPLPPAMTKMLESYDMQVAEAEKQGGEGGENQQGTVLVKAAIAPLIKTKWGQDAPYNNLTPTEKQGGKTIHCPTGCVATAMAMVMKYHQWPQGATTVVPATLFYDKDLPATTFNWAAMTNEYNEKSSKESCDAVALLMKYCGAANKMNYGPTQSASNSFQLSLGLIRYMGYDPESIQVTRRAYLTEREWENLIYDELLDNRPVIGDGDGHVFIIDGYQEGDYFHVNWGWDGNKDGYFRISVRAAREKFVSNLYHFPYCVVTGIKPVKTPYTNAERLTTQGILLTDDTPLEMKRSGDTDFGAVKARLVMQNLCSQYKAYTFDAGMALYNKDNTLLKTWETTSNYQMDYDANLENVVATMTFGKGLADGEYRLYPVSRVSGTKEWYTNEDVTQQYILVNISGDKMTLTTVPRDYRLTIKSIEPYGDLREGGEVTVVMKITNNSTYDYDGVFILADDVDGTFEKAASLKETFHHLPAGETADVQFKFIGGTPKTYQLCFIFESFMLGTRVPMEIKGGDENPPTNLCKIEKTITLKNGQYTGKDEYDFPVYQIKGRVLDATVTLKNTDTKSPYAGIVQFDIEHTNETTGMVERLRTLGKQQVTIAPGQTKDVRFYDDKLDRMTSYYMNIRTSYDDDVASDPQSLYATMTMVNAINVFKADNTVLSVPPTATYQVPDDAVAVELYDAGVKTLTPGKNPNCLYFLNKTDALPATLSGRNVVLYDPNANTLTAEKITLSDSYGFVSPCYFQAKEITCQRTFTEAEHSGYTTFALPFDVQKYEAGGQKFTLSFFQFNSDTPGKVYVSKIDEYPQGGRPYLLQLRAATPLTSPVTFSAKNASIYSKSVVEAAGNYEVKGTYLTEKYDDDAEAYAFALGTSGDALPLAKSCPPFRVAFQTIGMPMRHKNLPIEETNPTGITTPRHTPHATPQYYNLSGQRVSRPQRGLYITNGHKFVIK